jgi:hypothetical protein
LNGYKIAKNRVGVTLAVTFGVTFFGLEKRKVPIGVTFGVTFFGFFF